jgi:cytochrome c oxidase assembly protein subunit 15
MATALLTTETTPPALGSGTPRWLHVVAVATAVTALPLLFLGAEVTTKQVGMVDQVGLRQPWHLFTFVSERARDQGMSFFADRSNWGLLIEHSHRTFGWMVGMCAITLALGLGFGQKNVALRWLGLAALLAVSLQGVLGILRVNYNPLAGREIAMIHGCSAQLVFALLVSVAYLTSSIWKDGFGSSLACAKADSRLWWASALTAGFVYLQIVFGAVVRHTDSVMGPRVHLLLAFCVVATATALGVDYLNTQPRDVRLTRLLKVLCALLVLQLVLGVEAWMSKFTTGGQWIQLKPMTAYPDLARSLHLLVGSLLFATSVAITLRVYLGRSMATSSAAASVRRAEGAA